MLPRDSFDIILKYLKLVNISNQFFRKILFFLTLPTPGDFLTFLCSSSFFGAFAV